jgi:hypothetical protein
LLFEQSSPIAPVALVRTVMSRGRLARGPLREGFRFAIDEGTSLIRWDLVLNVGDIVEQPPVLAFDGTPASPAPCLRR